jgi:protein RecA
MAKKQKPEGESEITNDLFTMISKGIGAEILDDRDKTLWTCIDTGILALNYALSGKFVGGGVPGGTVMETFGGSSSGKTLFGTNLLRGTQTANGIAAMLDAEQTLSKDFAVKASHVDPKKFIVFTADTLENAFNRIHKLIRQVRQEAKVPLERPLVIVYDSIAVSPSEREFAETELDMETVSKAAMKEAGAGSDKPGERAKICSKELRKLPKILADNNTTILFINQTRQKIGVMYGDPTTTAGGGTSLEFYCTLRLKLQGSKHIKDKSGKVIGINVNLKCIKNKTFRPFTEVRSVRLFFDKGIDPFGGLLELLLQEQRIEAVKPAGTYKVCEPYSGGEEITFKSNKERNDVPADILLKCPALVDATDPSQVQYYCDMFGSALSAVENDIGVEEDIQNEE